MEAPATTIVVPAVSVLPDPVSEAIPSPPVRHSDAQALNTVLVLAQHASEKRADPKIQKAKEAFTDASQALEQAGKEKEFAEKQYGFATGRKEDGERNLKLAIAKANRTKVTTELPALKADQTTLNEKEANTLSSLTDKKNALAAAEADFAEAKKLVDLAVKPASAADEALKDAIDSQEFDLAAMPAVDLAKLSMVVNDLDSKGPDPSKAIREAISARFKNPDQETVLNIAQASRDESCKRALSMAITRMDPKPLSVLFTAVQSQGDRFEDAEDPFVDEILKHVGDFDLPSLTTLHEQAASMTPVARDKFVKSLVAGILKSIDSSRDVNAEQHQLLSEKLAAVAGWSSPEGVPYLAGLSTVEVTAVFKTMHNDARWSASESGKNLVAQFSSRFQECLMSAAGSAANNETARKAFDVALSAAISTNYVERLPTPEIGRLFAHLQKNETWRGASAAPFTSQVNSRFLNDYLGSINGATAQVERDELTTLLVDLANDWNTNVAESVRTGQVENTAQANTPFGTLNVDDVAALFVANQRIAPLLPASANVSTGAVAAKFMACYPQVKLSTHEMLISSYPAMSAQGQKTFATAANRPPEELKDLLEQVFKKFLGQMNVNVRDSSKRALDGFQQLIKYRTELPGQGSRSEVANWLRKSLQNVEGAPIIVAMFLNAPGAFRDAWLGGDVVLASYLQTAASAAQALIPEEWHKLAATRSISVFFADKNRRWSPDLQNHFERQFKLKPKQTLGEVIALKKVEQAPEEVMCRYHLEVLKAYQTLLDSETISNRDAKILLKQIQSRAPATRTSGQGLTSFEMAVQINKNGGAAGRRDSLEKALSGLAATAELELTTQGAKYYQKMRSLEFA